jgi:pimeloyl-ACP methyl ester carboxylesterase
MVTALPVFQAEAENVGAEFLNGADGLQLAFERHGERSAPCLLFAHGFGQTRQAWSGAAREFAAHGWQCIAADARGHGDSGWRADGEYDFDQFIDDLARLARAHAHGGRKPILIGASMGGLLGLMVQARCDAFAALVLVDITPRWENAGIERILAFMRAHPRGFADVDEAADAIARHLPHRRERKPPEKLRSLLVRADDGRLRWHWDPRLLARIADDGERQQAALLDAARRVRVPTLLVSGSNSDVVSAATIAEFLALVPHARHVRVAGATHMVAGDRHDAVAATVLEFIEALQIPNG